MRTIRAAAVLVVLLAMFAEPAHIEPRFKRSPKGWLPSCPANLDLVRHVPAPDCFWGAAPMARKPVQGEFGCIAIGLATRLPACPAE